jgi:hypothetical protein
LHALRAAALLTWWRSKLCAAVRAKPASGLRAAAKLGWRLAGDSNLVLLLGLLLSLGLLLLLLLLLLQRMLMLLEVCANLLLLLLQLLQRRVGEAHAEADVS